MKYNSTPTDSRLMEHTKLEKHKEEIAFYRRLKKIQSSNFNRSIAILAARIQEATGDSKLDLLLKLLSI